MVIGGASESGSALVSDIQSLDLESLGLKKLDPGQALFFSQSLAMFETHFPGPYTVHVKSNARSWRFAF